MRMLAFTRRRVIKKTIEEMARDGLIFWTGDWRNGRRVYRITELGRAVMENFNAEAAHGAAQCDIELNGRSDL
jgi:DNA-binding PadR family transcriptional regulator